MRLELAKFEGENIGSSLTEEQGQQFYRDMRPAAVHILLVAAPKQGGNESKRGEQLSCNGVIVHSTGLILTTFLPIEDCTITIIYYNGTRRQATVIRQSEERDVALLLPQPLNEDDQLDIDAKYVNISPNHLRICQPVIAIGSIACYKEIKFCFERNFVSKVNNCRAKQRIRREYLFFNMKFDDGCPIFNLKGELVALLYGCIYDFDRAIGGDTLNTCCQIWFSELTK